MTDPVDDATTSRSFRRRKTIKYALLGVGLIAIGTTIMIVVARHTHVHKRDPKATIAAGLTWGSGLWYLGRALYISLR